MRRVVQVVWENRGGQQTVTFDEAVAQLIDEIPSAETILDWRGVIDSAKKHILSLTTENVALRHEVNALRAKLGMGRKYVEWDKNKPTGGCPVSGG